MSQAGIPIISDIAQAAVNTANATTGIFKGDNVFESLGRITTAPMLVGNSATQTATNLISKDARLPIIGEATYYSREALYNPKDKENIWLAARETNRAAATILAAKLAAPALASGAASAGIGSGTAGIVEYGVSASASSALLKGNPKAALDIFGKYAFDNVPEIRTALGLRDKAASAYEKYFGGGQGVQAQTPFYESNINSPAQSLVQSNNTWIYVIGIFGIAGFIYLKGRK